MKHAKLQMTKELLPLSPGLKLSCRPFPPLPSSLLYLEKATNTTGLGLQLLARSLSLHSPKDRYRVMEKTQALKFRRPGYTSRCCHFLAL